MADVDQMPRLVGPEAYPEENIFTPCAASGAGFRILLAATLARTGLHSSEVQRILYFVYPERIWLSRLPPHAHRLLKRDLSLLQEHLRYNPFPQPVSVCLAPPGAWASHLPRLGCGDKGHGLEFACLAHRAEEFALVVHGLSRYGSNVRDLRVVVDLREELAVSAPAQGAAALMFAFLARGGLEGLRHLSLLHAGGGGDAGACLAPLARAGAAGAGPLAKLESLRLSLAEPREPLEHLSRLAGLGRLQSLRSVAFFGAPTPAKDTELAELLRALLRPTRPLAQLDLRGSLAGPATLATLVDRLGSGAAPKLRGVQLDGTPASDAEHASARGRLEELLAAQAVAGR